MRNGVWVLVALSVLSLAAGCGRSDETEKAPPTDIPQPIDSSESIATLDSGTIDPALICPPARGEGTISPAVSIYSITFVVNDFEQVVNTEARTLCRWLLASFPFQGQVILGSSARTGDISPRC
jgi:hypothetical protein